MRKTSIPQTVRTLFFDMNNTMIDPEQSFERCFTNILSDFTGRWEPDDPAATPDKAVQLYLSEWNKRKSKGGADTFELRKQCLKAALRHYPFAVNDAFVHSFFREMKKQQRQHAVLFPHAAETVRALAKHYQLAVISNGNRDVQHGMITRFGLSGELPMERIFTSKKGEYRKPDPAIFLHALKNTSTPPSEAVMIGDSWTNDIAGALKCGMHAVWINRNSGKKITGRKIGKQKVTVIRHIQELRDVLPFEG